MNNQAKYCDGDYQHKVGEFVNREVLYCVSSLISDLYQMESEHGGEYAEELFELFSQVDLDATLENNNFRVIERKNGEFIWLDNSCGTFGMIRDAINTQYFLNYDECVQSCIDQNNLDPDYMEVFEHWIVTGWLANKLKERGQVVADDIHGLTVWGRCTTGQSILLDRVICDIYDELHTS